MQYIKVRKVIFVRTIMAMEDCMPVKKIFVERLREYVFDCTNNMDSPIIQILQYCQDFGVIEDIRNMVNGQCVEKATWKKLVWERAWEGEQVKWDDHMVSDEKLNLLKMVTNAPGYSIWWEIADRDQSL